MEEEETKVVSISELLLRCRPLTGASSLTSNRSIRSSIKPSDNHPKPSVPVDPTPHNRNANSRVLESLSHPTILVGTLSLPAHDDPSNSSTTLCCSRTNCFLFSDGSSQICCDVLELDLRIIGKKIHIIAWNFIPFKHGDGGFLEIIRWSLPNGLNRCSSNSDVFPLCAVSSVESKEDNSKARHCIHGTIESVSPVSVVPCKMGMSSSWDSNSGCSTRNLRGFLVRIMICECKLRCSQDLSMDLDETAQGKDHHSFLRPEFVYFSGFASSWHPVISKWIGNVVSLRGLRKKLVFIGKTDSQLMYITTGKSLLYTLKFSNHWLPNIKTVFKGKGECGAYIGTITGIYMNGIIVELDQDVWLLLTDKQFTPPHCLRVGAIVSLRNVHFVNPKFLWAKFLVLGACYKTSIIVESFSPLEAGCHIYSHSESLLGKFIDSLTFSARLWVLLVVACFKKKFNGILSEKDILGSRHKEGLAQTYARSHLPLSMFQTRLGVFAEFCRHDSCGCSNEPNYVPLKLVVPISNFVNHCETAWLKMRLERKTDCDLMGDSKISNQHGLLSCEGRHCGQSPRRILKSEDIDVVLLASLRICRSSGRLELFDATGSINIVIPDLFSTWNTESILEINDFAIVTDGKFVDIGHLGALYNESFSCRSIFNYVPAPKEINLGMYIHFHMRRTKSINSPFYPCINWQGNYEELESGKFHLFLVTHKFPPLQKFQSDQAISNVSSIFAEAMVLPWSLFVGEKGGIPHPINGRGERLKNSMEHYASKKDEECVSNKRCKINPTSVLSDARNASCSLLNCSSAYGTSHGEWKDYKLSSPLELPCLVTVRSVNDYSWASSGFLHFSKSDIKIGAGLKSNARRILLEFTPESFCKYQLLQIGSYYIIKHQNADVLCAHGDFNYISGGKVHITCKTNIWSLSFYSHEFSPKTDPSLILPFNNNEVSSGRSQIELSVLRFDGNGHEFSSDVYICLCPDDVNFLEDVLRKPLFKCEAPSNRSPFTGSMMTASVQFSGTSGLDYLLPEGNFISLHGYITSVQYADCSSLSAHSTHEIPNDLPYPKYFRGASSSVIVHVLVDCCIVRIAGALAKHAYPIGFGPGANATFHRILVLDGQSELRLTPASFIVINSMRVVNDNRSDNYCNPSVASGSGIIESPDTVPSCLISEIIKFLDHKKIQLNCRVVAVYALVLGKKRKIISLQSGNNPRLPEINIPLAGFVLDDGSSNCCCWANSERAAAMLRLHEIQCKASWRSICRSEKIRKFEDGITSAHLIDRILKKHDKVIAKNYGSMFDSSCQDLTFSVDSDNILKSSDADLLKFITLNACFGALWTVVGTALDSKTIEHIERCYPEVEMTMHPMQNIWASEVDFTEPLCKARNVMKGLLGR